VWRWVVLALLLGAGCGVAAPDAAPPRWRVFVLGRAQDGGLPHVGCDRACCAQARASGRRETPACLGVHDAATGKLLLLEATPAVEEQLALLHRLAGVAPRGRAPVDGVLITHAHIGHYLGLAHFGREVCATDGLPLWVSPRMAAFLRAHGPWQQLVALEQIALHEVAPGSTFTPLPGLAVEAIAVPHRDEFSDTLAFKLRGPNRGVLFVPDVDAWSKHTGLLERLLAGVDVAYIDGTFYDGSELPERVRAEIPHPTMRDTMARLSAWAQARPGAVRFIHLNHSNPAFAGGGLAPGFKLAEVGEAVGL
jgi:pyrroloquinoline quinone biosynthesis protein B